MSKPSRVLVADSTRIYRQIFVELFARCCELELVGLAGSGPALLSQLALTSAELAVLDVSIAAAERFATLKRLVAQGELGVLVVGPPTVEASRLMHRCVTLGALDCVPKPATLGHLDRVLLDLESRLVPRIQYWIARRQIDRLEEKPLGKPAEDQPIVLSGDEAEGMGAELRKATGRANAPARG